MGKRPSVAGKDAGNFSRFELVNVQAQVAEWLRRLMDVQDFQYDEGFFSCFEWCCNALKPILTTLQQEAAQKKLRVLASAKVRKKLKEMQETSWRDLPDAFESLLDAFPATRSVVANALAVALEQAASLKKQPDIVGHMATFFGLDEDALKICTFAFLVHNYNKCRYFSHEDFDEYENRHCLATMLDIPEARLSAQIAQLLSMGILSDSYDNLHLSSNIETAWREGSYEHLERSFCLPLSQSDIAFEQCHVKAEDKKHVLELLAHAGDMPRHILLYGAPGTGKTTFARCLADALGVNAWAVPCKDDDSPADRRAALVACIHLAGQHKKAFVLVDEAEYILDTDQGEHRNMASPKAWLTAFLEQKNVSVIWITNHVEHLDPAIRRRFAYSIHFPELNKKERCNLWRAVSKRLRLACRLSDDVIQQLSERYPVQVAVMESSLRQARAIASREEFLPRLEQILSAHLTLQHDGEKPSCCKARPKEEDFTLDGTCMQGSVHDFVARCRKLDAYMRQDNGSFRPCMGNMLFYGPPGTGKTAMARHIAHVLDRPGLVKRASDLLDMYVGGTEARIAAAFREARDEGAVLIMDEVDSFLQGREGAQRSWEITQVNEFLTQLEQCNSFCICTTNFREVLDSAAMRRFSFKIRFGYAGPEQLETLYRTLLAPLAAGEPQMSILEALRCQKCLTPGDFQTVKMQFWLEEPGSVAHETLLEALCREQALKLESSVRKLGF